MSHPGPGAVECQRAAAGIMAAYFTDNRPANSRSVFNRVMTADEESE
jgi:hypothetical protein